MKTVEKNVPLLRKVYEHISAHPEQWYQGLWAVDIDALRAKAEDEKNIVFNISRLILRDIEEVKGKEACGTAYCFAGWACEINGDEWDLSHAIAQANVMVDGERVQVCSRARDLLGLDDAEAIRLFDANNTLPTIERYLQDWGVL